MLAASVDAFKGFLVQQAYKSVLIRYFFHNLHGHLVVVYRHICRVKDRSQLMLCRSHLVVLGLCRDSQLPEGFVQVMHIGGDAGL